MAASVNRNQAPVGESAETGSRDFRQEVTDRIIQMLEAGVALWQKLWNPTDASLDMPMNPTIVKAYRGGRSKAYRNRQAKARALHRTGQSISNISHQLGVEKQVVQRSRVVLSTSRPHRLPQWAGG